MPCNKQSTSEFHVLFRCPDFFSFTHLFFKNFVYTVWVAIHLSAIPQWPEEGSGSPELELQVVMNCHVGDEN